MKLITVVRVKISLFYLKFRLISKNALHLTSVLRQFSHPYENCLELHHKPDEMSFCFPKRIFVIQKKRRIGIMWLQKLTACIHHSCCKQSIILPQTLSLFPEGWMCKPFLNDLPGFKTSSTVICRIQSGWNVMPL